MDYGETGKTLTVAAGSPDGGALSYQWYSNKTDSTEGGTSVATGGSLATYAVPSQLAAGTYYYYCMVTNTRNGATASVTSSVAAVAVKRLTPTAADFVFAAPSALGYNGSEKTASVTAASDVTGMGAITVNYYSGNTKLDSAPTNVGAYTVKINVTEGTGYSALTDFTDDTWKFTISAADVTISGTDAQVTYAGNTYDVSKMFTRDGNAGTPTYSIADGGTGAGTLSGSNLTMTKAGTIKITMETAAQGNYAADSVTATLTVSKGSVTVPTITGKPYNGAVQAADLSEASGADGYTIRNEGGTTAGDYDVVLTLRTPDLYKWGDGTAAAEKTLTFTIAQATNQWSSELACTGFGYDGTSKLAPGATAAFGTVAYTYCAERDGTYSEIPADGIKNAGTYYIKAAVEAATSYTGLESEPLSVTISKAVLEPSVASVTGKPYDGNTTAAGTITLAGAVNSEKPTAAGTFVWTSENAGTDTVNVSDIALDTAWSTNYQLSETSLSNVTAPGGAKIANAELTNVSVAQDGALNYNGAAQTAAVNTAATAVNAQDVTFTYSSDIAGNYTNAVPAFTAADEYTVYYKAQAANHNEASGSFTVTIGKKPSDAVPTPDAPTIGAGEDRPASTSITIDTVAGNEYYISTASEEPTVWPTSGDDYFKAAESGTHTFTGLTAGTKYYIHTRFAETENAMPSGSALAEVYTLPVTPTAGVGTIDYAKETISFDSLYELSGEADFGTMIASGDAIMPNTLYYIRVKAAPGGVPASEAASFKTAARPAAPAAVSVKDISKTDRTITVSNTVSTQEYSIDNGETWTNGNGSALLFSGLTAGRSYPVVTRLKAVTAAGSEAFASENSTALAVAAKTAPADVPGNHGVAFSVVDGTVTGLGTTYEWRTGDSGAWSTLSGGITFTEGTLYIRAAETEASMPGNALQLGSIKAGPAAPDAPVKESATSSSVTLAATAGNEYSRDGGATWQDSGVFTGLNANTAYGFVARVKATADTLAGKTSPAATIKTDADNGGAAFYMITATAGAGGDISTGQYVSVREGESAGFTMIPHKGYQVADVKVDGKSVGAVANYVFTDVRAAHTITVTFKVSSGHVNPQTGVALGALVSEK